MNWRVISQDPVDPKVHDFLLNELKQKKLVCTDGLDFLRKFVEGCSVLDIGVVEHDITHIQSDTWKHRKIKQWAKKVVGVDILEGEVNMLNGMGYDIKLVDATSSVDLGERFERIVIGDVIEHVSNPVRLLEFASRHLAVDGVIMVSTPNPFNYAFILKAIGEGTFIANAEHVSWISPTMAMEIGSRAGLQLKTYHPQIGRPKSLVKRILKKIFSPALSGDNEIYASYYIYLYGK